MTASESAPRANGNRPSARWQRHAAVERRHGKEQLKRAEQHACARKAVKPKLSGEGGKRKAGRRTGKTDCGASAAALWQGAAKHGAAGGKRQPKHPTVRKGQHQHMPQLVYGRGKQEQRQGIGFVHTPERGQQHEEPVADFKPFHLKLGQVIGWVKGGAILPQLKVQVRAGRVAGLADACDFLPAAYRIAHLEPRRCCSARKAWKSRRRGLQLDNCRSSTPRSRAPSHPQRRRSGRLHPLRCRGRNESPGCPVVGLRRLPKSEVNVPSAGRMCSNSIG